MQNVESLKGIICPPIPAKSAPSVLNTSRFFRFRQNRDVYRFLVAVVTAPLSLA